MIFKSSLECWQKLRQRQQQALRNLVPEILRESGVEVTDLVSSYIKAIVKVLKQADENTKGETCRRCWERPVTEIWGNL